jgi:hypothetical protein
MDVEEVRDHFSYDLWLLKIQILGGNYTTALLVEACWSKSLHCYSQRYCS